MKSEDWVLSGGGNQGDSYVSDTDPTVILKLYRENFDKEYVVKEYEFNKAISAAGVKCPEALEMVFYRNRWGIVFRRIPNKKSFCRLAGEHPELIPSLAKRLADMLKEVHSKTAEGTCFSSLCNMFKAILESNTLIDDRMRGIMEKAFSRIEREERMTLLHGDFHFGNAITDGEEDYFIDLGNFSYGHPNFDISMFYLISHYGPEELIESNFHLNQAQGIAFWEEFKKCYYGKEKSDEDLLPELKDYLLVRTLWIQKDTDNQPFVQPLMDLFSREDLPCFARVF